LESAKLIKYVLSAVSAYYGGNFQEFQNLDYDSAIREYYDKNKIDHFGINFNSPGKFQSIFNASSASALISASLALVTDGSVTGMTAVKELVLNKVLQALKGDSHQIRNDVTDFIGSIRDDKWEQIRRNAGAPAADDLGLTLDAQEFHQALGDDEAS
jgi:hypothetical protein